MLGFNAADTWRGLRIAGNNNFGLDYRDAKHRAEVEEFSLPTSSPCDGTGYRRRHRLPLQAIPNHHRALRR
jgi:hypothetical protein